VCVGPFVAGVGCAAGTSLQLCPARVFNQLRCVASGAMSRLGSVEDAVVELGE
jgi:hypothetical protein